MGKPSRIQIEKGFEYLIAVEHALRKGAPKTELDRVSSLFYTTVSEGDINSGNTNWFGMYNGVCRD